MKGYPAVIHQEDEKFIVSFPDLEGCFTSGDTVESAYENAKEALGLYLDSDGDIYKRSINKPSNLRQVKKEFPNDKVVMIKTWENDFFTPMLTIIICMACLSMTTFAWYTLQRESGVAMINAKITQSSIEVYKIVGEGTEEPVDFNNGFNLVSGFKYRVHITNSGSANCYHGTVSVIQSSVPYLIDTDRYGTEFDFFIVPVSDTIVDFTTKWGTSSAPELQANKVLLADNGLTVIDNYADEPTTEPATDEGEDPTQSEPTVESDEPSIEQDKSNSELGEPSAEPDEPNVEQNEPSIENETDINNETPETNEPLTSEVSESGTDNEPELNAEVNIEPNNENQEQG